MKQSSFRIRSPMNSYYWLRFRNALVKLFSIHLLIGIMIAAFAITIAQQLSYLPLKYSDLAILTVICSILIYLIYERSSVLEEIIDNLRGAKAHLYSTRESLYMAAIQLLAEGVPNGRRNEERLEMVVARLEELEDAENYEVRAFSIKNIPILSPLIIGEEHVFLSTEDPQYYRVKQGICIQSKDCVNLVKDYFESLWNNSQMINQELRILNECLERKGVLASIRRSSLA